MDKIFCRTKVSKISNGCISLFVGACDILLTFIKLCMIFIKYCTTIKGLIDMVLNMLSRPLLLQKNAKLPVSSSSIIFFLKPQSFSYINNSPVFLIFNMHTYIYISNRYKSILYFRNGSYNIV